MYAVAEREDPSHAAILPCCFVGLDHSSIILGCLLLTLMISYSDLSQPPVEPSAKFLFTDFALCFIHTYCKKYFATLSGL